jgi:hypothetical protein
MRSAYLRLAMIMGAAAFAVGCKSQWPPFDESKTSLVLAAGTFSGVHETGAPPCLMDLSGDPELAGVVDCWSGTPSITTLNVFDVLYGRVTRSALPVGFHPSLMEKGKPPGGGRPQLTLLQSDGRHFLLTYERLPIAQTVTGEWALPIEEVAMLTILPCGAEPLVQPLRFAHPRPVYPLDEYTPDDVERLRQNPWVKVEGGHYSITHGILFEDIRTFLASVAPATDDYYCRAYEFPEESGPASNP